MVNSIQFGYKNKLVYKNIVFIKELLYFIRNGNNSSASFNKIMTTLTVEVPLPILSHQLSSHPSFIVLLRTLQEFRKQLPTDCLARMSYDTTREMEVKLICRRPTFTKQFHKVSYNYSISQINVKGY